MAKHYGSTVAVDDLSFEVHEGQVTGFLGPNGAGKSTTLRMILGLDKPAAEMALTADHVIVIGRGKLLAESSISDLVTSSTQNYVRVRSPQQAELSALIGGNGGSSTLRPDGSLAVTGLEAPKSVILPRPAGLPFTNWLLRPHRWKTFT